MARVSLSVDGCDQSGKLTGSRCVHRGTLPRRCFATCVFLHSVMLPVSVRLFLPSAVGFNSSRTSCLHSTYDAFNVSARIARVPASPHRTMAGKQPSIRAGPPPVLSMMESQPNIEANRAFVGAQKQDNQFILSTPWDALIPCNTCTVMPERTNIVELYVGEYHGTITEPGCYCRNSLVVELRSVSTALNTFDLPNTKVVDLRGNPLIVSGLVTLEVVDARKAAIDVVDAVKYVQDMAPAVLKRVISQYPYEAHVDGGEETTCLRSDTDDIGKHMRDALQDKCNPAGVRIEQFTINELSYAPEISQAMLKSQQANAMILARKSIVLGARQMAIDTVKAVESVVEPEDRNELLMNLLIVLVGEEGSAAPTLAVRPL